MRSVISLIRRANASTFLLVWGYGLFIYCFLLFCAKAGYIAHMPDDASLFRWDGSIYADIARQGYVYPDPQRNNTGCFILFPLVWRCLHVGTMGICIVNYLFFAAGFTLLTRIYKISTAEKLMWLSFPTVYIMFIPYTEALFFLLLAITFVGILKKKRGLIWAGLFFASLTRATGIFLLPSLLVMELIANHNKQWYKLLPGYIIDYALPILAGLALFTWYQYYKTGIWFAYFIQQQKYEGHVFNMPILPFSSMEGYRNLWISALAMFCCFISVIFVVKKLFKWLFRNVQEPDRLLVLSLAFLGVTLYKTIFYNPTWDTGTTLTMGISRYVFATPFFYVFLYHFTHRATAYRPAHFLAAFTLCNITWLSCGEYEHIRIFFYLNFCTAIVLLYMLITFSKLSWPLIVLTGINIFFQVIMFQQYLGGMYLD